MHVCVIVSIWRLRLSEDLLGGGSAPIARCLDVELWQAGDPRGAEEPLGLASAEAVAAGFPLAADAAARAPPPMSAATGRESGERALLVHAVFDLCDNDRDGRLSCAELRRAGVGSLGRGGCRWDPQPESVVFGKKQECHCLRRSRGRLLPPEG